MRKYNPQKIEKKWQKEWEEKKLYKTSDDQKKPKYYILDMFPYPSGAGLHVGHPKGYIATDIIARMKMMQGHNVLHPMGWDAFGLPAENFAIKNKVHPREMNEKNIATFKKQLSKLGFTYDWSREINTTDPEYYKWTQWVFLQMYKKGLAYESHEPINWCPSCQTGLANEDLENGLCERCGSEIEQKPMRQWVLKITDYADRMLEDLNKLTEWPKHIKEMQKNWIGRSEGTKIKFSISNSQFSNNDQIEVFTTRVDTIFGCTYLVVAPEHELIVNYESQITNYKEVADYIEKSKKKTELERTELQKEKTGIKLKGIKAVNPFNNEEVPIFVADYVLGNYGTGAVMAVPAHDERDFEFATRYNKSRTDAEKIEIRQSIAPHFIDTKNPPRPASEGKKLVPRRAIQCVVKHWKKNQILNLHWKKFDWKTFIVGGVKEGETPEEAALRELKEETGYKNIKSIKKIGGEFHSEFFAAHKDVNRYAYMQGFYIELKDGEKQETALEEHEQFDIIWTDFDKVEEKLTSDDIRTMWNNLNNDNEVFTGNGILIDSGEFTGLESTEARKKMTAWLEKNNLGGAEVNYKLKDWVFSRQRYWGEPIPIVHCEKCGVQAVPEKDLPVVLPDVKSYEPTGTGESPLAGIDEWVNTKCPKCGGPAKRETNTMPQWAGSSWYYLRYIDPKNSKELVDKKKEKYWSPVDFYVGGAEHATRHLIYARFWHKFLFDIGVVNYEEPFTRLQNVGLIMAEDGRKMSKRWGNVINPDDVVKEYGADAMRVYEMFMGPFDQGCAWNTKGLIGAKRFLEKVFSLFERARTGADFTRTNADGRQEKSKVEFVDCKGGCGNVSKEIPPLFHKTIKKVTEDIESMNFNTAISQMMIFVNECTKHKTLPKSAMERFLTLLSPFAPHIAEELWSELGHKKSIFLEEWPKYNEKMIKDETIEMVIQVNGKVRDRIQVSADISEEDAKKKSLASKKVQKHIDGKEIKKVIFVKGRLINIVV